MDDKSENTRGVASATQFDAAYQGALQIIRQSWLDVGMTPEEYDEGERRREEFIRQIEERWAKNEPIDDLLMPVDLLQTHEKVVSSKF